MNETGVDFFLDLHGDPRAEWVFTSGMEGVPRYDEWCAALRAAAAPVPPHSRELADGPQLLPRSLPPPAAACTPPTNPAHTHCPAPCRLAGVEEGFKAALVEADPDYLPAPGYPVDKPGEADLRIASYQVGGRAVLIRAGLG